MNTQVPELPPDTQTIEIALADNYGLLRGKRVPARAWGEASSGITLTNIVFSWSPRCEVRRADIWGGPESGWGDIRAVPMPATLRTVPWRRNAALVLCEAYMPDGSPVPLDPRNALAGVLDRVARAGYTVKLGYEVEFYLIDAETRRPREDTVECYGLGRGAAYEWLLGPLRDHLLAFGLPVEACHPEYGPGQFEISLAFGDAMQVADAGVLLRHAVKEYASEHGLVATFMGKVLTDEAGSGLHIHHSLWQDGENTFSDEGKLSDLGRWYLGGMQRFMSELSLFGTPTPNGMKRRQPRQFAPLTNAWARDSRTAALRVMTGAPGSVRIEQRDAAADCNPYLAMAAQIAAGWRGVEEQMEPAPESLADARGISNGERLPSTIAEAVAAAERSALARSTFDPLLLRTVIDCALHEQAYFDGTVSELERGRYLGIF